jgi:exodeoxyribonuclease VII large subunit
MSDNCGKTPENAISPSQLNNLARRTLEKQLGSVWLRGEISDLYKAASGHAYFSLKDSQSSIKCTFFKQYNFKKIELNNGEDLLAFGQATLYEERGTFQLKVERVEKSGIGDMAKAFAELKVKLEALGYFSPEHKKPLPSVINSLGIVTSTSSAAITDVLNVIKRRNPLLEVKIYHASVQGEKAVEEIIDALLQADINQHDVILLTRGGGSEEDLWIFNDVSIAQTLFNLTTPSVSAIGHERDTSISDLVADVSAITPSAAAELLTPDLLQLKTTLKNNLKRLQQIMLNRIQSHTQQLDISYHKLEKSHPHNAIENERKSLQYKSEKLKQSITQIFNDKQSQFNFLTKRLGQCDFKLKEKQDTIQYYKNNLHNLISLKHEQKHMQLQSLGQKLHALSPLATLSRGYSITLKQDTQEVITNSKQLAIGDELETIVEKGKVISKVSYVKP